MYQDSDAGNRIVDFSEEYYCSSFRLSSETLMEEIKPIDTDNEFEYRGKSTKVRPFAFSGLSRV